MKKSHLIVVVLMVAAIAGGAWFWKTHAPIPADGALGQAAYRHTEAILSHGPRPAGSPALADVRAYLRTTLEKSGWVTQEQSFKRTTPVGEITFVNLRARLAVKGIDPWAVPSEGILCAHVDSKKIPDVDFLGADDAASSCAAILEMAGWLSERRPEQAAKLELVFFDGEEGFGPSMTTFDGIYGSHEYSNLWRDKPAKPRFGILLDMIGHKDLRIELPADSPAFLKDHIMAAADEEGVAKHFHVSALGDMLDDHVPLNQAGIPAIDVIGDFSAVRWWHNKGGAKDDLSVISADSLDVSMRVVLRTLDRLLAK